jgi:hypothetical protein
VRSHNLTTSSELQWVVTTKQDKIPRPTAEFGAAISKALAAIGKDERDLAKELGGLSESTMGRLRRGQGNASLAIRAVRALKRMGADVSNFPAVAPDLEPGQADPMEEHDEWMERWNRMGQLLHRYSNSATIERSTVQQLRKMAAALEMVDADIEVEIDAAMHPSQIVKK